MTRQTTAKAILDVDWDFPMPATFGETKGDGHTVVDRTRFAWPRMEAFAKIAGDDPRPLLILRECTSCRGTEHALFGRRLNNEKTKLLLNWFHCVKLPPEVAKKNHPFHKVFAGKGRMPHLFIANAKGESRVEFNGAQSQSSLQKELIKLIRASYKKKPQPAIKAMLSFLSKFDMYDLKETELLQMIDLASEKSGPQSSSVKKLNKKLAKVRRDKAKAMKSAKAVCDLKLKVVKLSPKSSKKKAG